jgi:aminobenzoyl-glutamate utilization protein B
MKQIFSTIYFFCLGILTLFAQTDDKQVNKILKNALDKKMDHYAEVAHQIWEFAEVGYQEIQSTELLQAQLQAAGFSVENGVAGIPTAFVASYGSGQPVIGILAEFDALPGVSQAAVPMRQEREEVNAGHACGHHLFGTASSAAAIAIKDWLVTSGTSGTIRVYGTPAEEGGAGKVYMVREGLMDDVDAILHWHPGNENSADASSSLANKSGKFRFYGKASHASSAPDQGRSALDGVEAMNMMVNMMREHIPMESRIHYVITRGGEAPNVVPAYAEVYYYVRHPEAAVSGALFDRVVKAAEGAAIGTGTKMEYEVIHGIYNLLPNVTLAEKMYENLKKVGGFTYTEEEKSFAEKIHTTLGDPKAVTVANEIKPFEVRLRGTGGSTDVGDVSWVAPTAGLRTATWVPGTPAHSWQAVAAGGTSIGHKGMMVAAKTLTLTAIDIFKDPSLAEKAKKELNERRGKNFEYKPLLGDREPPLDYRN